MSNLIELFSARRRFYAVRLSYKRPRDVGELSRRLPACRSRDCGKHARPNLGGRIDNQTSACQSNSVGNAARTIVQAYHERQVLRANIQGAASELQNGEAQRPTDESRPE